MAVDYAEIFIEGFPPTFLKKSRQKTFHIGLFPEVKQFF